ncbi:hypothetical protein UFOVP157_27 [uncultured Caudovirales phage]|uniref:Uncharacterized protein n=1 Tax=uncultured Caudovirales phage TaxID=2100421 RepID=A0A6J7WA72_9CAUD|nr:hypothetical protein UFOVP157_27 [uncultured Caudovirales phage]
MNTTTLKKLPYGFIKLQSETIKPFVGKGFFKSDSVNALVMQNTLSGDWFVMKTNDNPKRIFDPLAFGSVKHALIYAGETYSINN